MVGSREHHTIGDVSRTLGAGIEVRGVQTEKHFFEEEISKLDKGVEVRLGRRHNKAHTLFMNNNSQTEIERHRYSWFVVLFIFVAILNIWYAYVSLNIHYKLSAPFSSEVDKPSHYKFLYPFRILKHIMPDWIVRMFTGK